MIEMKGISKKFGDVNALSKVSGTIEDGNIFGLVGTNGAGKSTCLRILSGILKPDEGTVHINEKPVYENEIIKREVFFISDDQYYFPNATPKDMMDYYQMFYPRFDYKRFEDLMKKLSLNWNAQIQNFSKGMKKQVSMILGICANTKYLLCDETFDGLDPVMRQAIKSVFAAEILNREFTPIIASHNLRELEDICDHVGLLHRGDMILSKSLEDMKGNIHKVQCVLSEEGKMHVVKELELLKLEQRGSLSTMTVRGDRDEIIKKIQKENPIFLEALPLSLEEIFISETEVVGYDVKSLLL